MSRAGVTALLRAALQAAAVLFLARRAELWPLAAAAVAAAELWAMRPGGTVARSGRRDLVLERMPAILMGLSVVMIIAVSPRFATQAATAVLYALWQIWWMSQRKDGAAAMANLLLLQVAMFEAVFLMAAVWRHTYLWAILLMVWLGAYLSVYAVLARRGERSAGVMAAAWGVIAVEVAWVLLSWLFVYTIGGGYILVPQPVLILTALAYCFGSIFVSQRDGTLSRARLGEYLVIGLILIAIVAIGTSWRGSI